MVGSSHLVFGQIMESTRALRQAASPVRQLNLAMRRSRSNRVGVRGAPVVAAGSTAGAARPALFAKRGWSRRRAGSGGAAAVGPCRRDGPGHARPDCRTKQTSRHRDTTAPVRHGLLRFLGEIDYSSPPRLSVESGCKQEKRAGDRAAERLRRPACMGRRRHTMAGAYRLSCSRLLLRIIGSGERVAEVQRLQMGLDKVSAPWTPITPSAIGHEQCAEQQGTDYRVSLPVPRFSVTI